MVPEDSKTPVEPYAIEPASWRDLNSLRYLEKACFPQDAWPLIELIGVLTLPTVIRLKAIQDGKMVGFIAADVRPGGRLAWIATLCVLPEYQRRGIGSSLLAACEERLKTPRIRLTVRASNQEAIRLYRRFGYQHHDYWKRYYQDGEAAVVLQKER